MVMEEFMELGNELNDVAVGGKGVSWFRNWGVRVFRWEEGRRPNLPIANHFYSEKNTFT